MRWCTFPGESLFKSVTMPIIKADPMCVDCDGEESKYLLGKQD